MNTRSNIVRAALYARFSTELQSEASIDDQFRACRRTALDAGHSVVATFEDRGISGGTCERAGYQALLSAARSGAFDIIVVEDISRLWRNRAEFGPRSAELEDMGIHLVTCVGDDTRRDGYGLVLGIKQAIAEHARKEISYRTRRGLEGLALAGKSTGGRCYGYRDGAVYEREGRAIRAIFQWRLAGASLAQIVAKLSDPDWGYPPPSSGAWSRSSVRNILANPRYAGQAIWGLRETKGGARDSAHKRAVKRPGGPLVSREDERLRIVPVELFEAVRGLQARAA